MKPSILALSFLALTLPLSSIAQADLGSAAFKPEVFRFDLAEPASMEGGGGGGQVAPSATQGARFTRLGIFGGVSAFGAGASISTNLSNHLDVRAFGNYLHVLDNFTDSGFDFKLDIELSNSAILADYYPLHHHSWRISPGYLVYNGNRVRLDYSAQPNTVFTLDNQDFQSDPNNPIHGTGRLHMTGSGFMATTGYGRYASNSSRHFTFPVEGGVAFIPTPFIDYSVYGYVCKTNNTGCELARNFPGFQAASDAQLAKWNDRAKPYNIFPFISFGVAYTIHPRLRRVVE